MSEEDTTEQESQERLIVRMKNDASIRPIIEKARANGWRVISARGSVELCRAVWIEGTMSGIEVRGYAPTVADNELITTLKKQYKSSGAFVMRADEVVEDYCRRVIPQLEQEYEMLRQKRAKLGITTTDLDRTYGINLPSGSNKDVEEKYIHAKGALIRAVEEREHFGGLGKKPIEVFQTFEDGVARFDSVEKEYGHNIGRNVGNQLKRSY